MANGSRPKMAPRVGKGAKGNGAGESQPFVYLPPPRDEALATADPLNERGELVCTSETTLDAAQMLEVYRWLQLTRLVEERLVNLYRQTKVVGGVFRSLGQEATAVGTAYALREQDFIS